MSIARTGRAVVVVDAPVEQVWAVVADVTRTGEWSHECRQVHWLNGATAAAPGARFRGRNRSGWLRWTRTCELTTVDRPHELAWRTVGTLLFVDSTDWRIVLEPVGAGTRIVESYQVTRLPGWLDWLLTRVNPSHVDRNAALAEDLRRLGLLAATTRTPQRMG